MFIEPRETGSFEDGDTPYHDEGLSQSALGTYEEGSGIGSELVGGDDVGAIADRLHSSIPPAITNPDSTDPVVENAARDNPPEAGAPDPYIEEISVEVQVVSSAEMGVSTDLAVIASEGRLGIDGLKQATAPDDEAISDANITVRQRDVADAQAAVSDVEMIVTETGPGDTGDEAAPGDEPVPGLERGVAHPDSENVEAAVDVSSRGGAGDGPPSFTIRELGPREPSPTARAIADRWAYDVRRTAEQQGFSVTAAIGEEAPMPILDDESLTKRSYARFVDNWLEAPDRKVEPVQVIADVITEHDIDLELMVAYTQETGLPATPDMIVNAIPPEEYVSRRETVRRALANEVGINVALWSRESVTGGDNLYFLHYLPAAREVAEANGVSLAEVYALPAAGQADLFAEAVRRTYPNGPQQFVGNRIRETRRGEQDANAAVYADALRGLGADAPPSDIVALGHVNRRVATTWEYAQRTFLGDEYEALVQGHLQGMQRRAVAATVYRLEETWGVTAHALVWGSGQRAWLNGEGVGTDSMVADRDRRISMSVTRLDQRMTRAVEAASVPPITVEDLKLLIPHAARYAARAAELDPAELVRLTVMLDVELTGSLMADGGVSHVSVENAVADPREPHPYVARLIADVINYGVLNNPPLPPDMVAGRTVITDSNFSPTRQEDLRLALVMRQLRLRYPSVFPQSINRLGAGYYNTRHFQAINTIFQSMLADYFEDTLRAPHGEQRGPLGAMGGIGTAPHVRGRVAVLDRANIPMDYSDGAIRADGLAEALYGMGANEFLLIGDEGGQPTTSEGAVGIFTGATQQITWDIHDPQIRSGLLTFRDQSHVVRLRSLLGFVEPGWSPEEQVAEEYAANMALNSRPANLRRLRGEEVVAFCRYFELDPNRGGLVERVGTIVRSNLDVVPYADVLFGHSRDERPTQEQTNLAMTQIAESFALLHGDNFTLSGTATIENIAVDPDSGQTYARDVRRLRVTPYDKAVNESLTHMDVTQDLAGLLGDMRQWMHEAPDVDFDEARRVFIASYRKAAGSWSQGLSDDFWRWTENWLGNL